MSRQTIRDPDFYSLPGSGLPAPAKLPDNLPASAKVPAGKVKSQGKPVRAEKVAPPRANGPALLEAWEKLLADVSEDDLVASVQELWNIFNRERGTQAPGYMERPRVLSAYLAAFLLPNIQRVFAVWSAAGMDDLRKRLASEKRIRIVDFGAGPLSATAGVLFALLREEGAAIRDVEVVAVERSGAAVDVGIGLLKRAFGRGVRLTVQRVDSLAHESVTDADIALGVNVFNEVPPKLRLSSFAALEKSVSSSANGVVCLIEPGQDRHAWALAKLRDSILKQSWAEGLRIVAPCLHVLPCPLSGNRPDWCWFRNRWRRPRRLVEIDSAVGLQHEELSYSFVVFAREAKKKGRRPQESDNARVVSDAIPLGRGRVSPPVQGWLRAEARGSDRAVRYVLQSSKGLHKCLLCQQSGELASLITRVDATLPARGSVVETTDHVVCRERPAKTISAR